MQTTNLLLITSLVIFSVLASPLLECVKLQKSRKLSFSQAMQFCSKNDLASDAPRTIRVSSPQQFATEIIAAKPMDSIIFIKSGDYGQMVIRDKSNIRIQGSPNVVVNGYFFIDGASSDIIIESMTLVHNSAPALVLSNTNAKRITVRFCLLSFATRVTMANYNVAMQGNPTAWNSGIRLRGPLSTVQGNKLANVKVGIIIEGPESTVQHNEIVFFSMDAMNIKSHRVKILQNVIASAVTQGALDGAHRDAIQLIPQEAQFDAGMISNIELVGNVISHKGKHPVQAANQAILQGIFGSDGYFVNITVKDNVITVNSDHGITFNGAKNFVATGNRIVARDTLAGFVPGIKLYLVRKGGEKNCWFDSYDFSVTHGGNVAPMFNAPSNYKIRSTEQPNTYGKIATEKTRGRASSEC